MKKFLLICGVSGSGKSFIEKQLVNQRINSTLKFNRLIQVTTREMREGEMDGESYIFINRDEYNRMKDNLIATTEFYGNCYGTPDYSKMYHDNGLNINTIVVNREGHDSAVADLKSKYKDCHICTIQIKNNDPMQREGRDYEREEKELDDISDYIFDNSPDNRLDIKKIIDTLYETGFIYEPKFH